MTQAKNTAPQCGIRVYKDGNSLALRFPVKYNPIFEQLDGKPIAKQKCLGLGGVERYPRQLEEGATDSTDY